MSTHVEKANVDRFKHLLALDAAARAVIAAGRPHPSQWNTNDQQDTSCLCPQCDAWDALKALLEETK